LDPPPQDVCLAATSAAFTDPEVCATSAELPARLRPMVRGSTAAPRRDPLPRLGIGALPVTGAQIFWLIRAATLMTAAGALLARLRRRPDLVIRHQDVAELEHSL
jgi:hypothetical protein